MLTTYNEYKVIDLPWMKKIPKHWQLLRNKNVMRESKNNVGDKFDKYQLLSLTKKGIIIRDISNGKGKFPKDFTTYKIVNRGDLVFCLFDIDETPRTVGLSNYEGMITGAYDIFQPLNVDSRYLCYYYISIDDVKALKPYYSSLRKVINPSVFLSIKIPIPPLNEQNQIVRFLDWKTDQMNYFIKQKRREIDRLEELKKALINQAVTKGLQDNIPMKRTGIDWMPEVPEHWKIDFIKQHFSVLKRIAGKEGYNILSITQNGIKVKDISHNEGQMAQNYANYQFVYPGEFAMNHMDLLTGYVGISDHIGVTSPDYRVFRLDDTVHCFAQYFLRIFQLGYKRHIFYKFGKGAASKGRWRLPKTAFLNYMIPIPPLAEQKRIVSECERIEGVIDELIESIHKEITLVEELRIRTIADVVTGKVDVRNVVIPDSGSDFIDTEENGEELVDDSEEA